MPVGDDKRTPPRGTEHTRPARERAGGSQRARRGGTVERLIAGVPARIMRPRLIFFCCLVAIVAFGLLMVYSASAVEAVSDGLAPTYYLERQVLFVVVGIIFMAAIALFPNFMASCKMQLSWILWSIGIFLLIVVFAVGLAGGGARRWMSIAGVFTLQPSELLKPALILVVAKLLVEYYSEHVLDFNGYAAKMAVAVAVPLFLIIIQPDLGTTLIIGVTVFAMMVLAGLPVRFVIMAFAALACGGVLAMIVAPYRMQRFLVMLDPWEDPYGDGYQATLAIMAFASGGLFGRGIGNSTIKYNYLPEAHNDYILAVIGEELGFVGTVLFFAVCALFIWSAFKIASESPTLYGRLVAEGSAIVLSVQFLVNALGILGLAPMTGKTMPFISYGGSSMIASMILAGLILRVSIDSGTASVYDARRSSFSVMARGGAVSARSRAGASAARRPEGFSVLDGSAARTRRGGRAQGAYERIDLNRDRADRLRSHGPTVRTRPRGSSRGDRYDR